MFCLGAVGAGVAFATSRPEAALAPGTARLVPGDAAVTVHRGSPTAAADAPLRSGDGLTVDRGTAIVETATGRLFARVGTTINFGDASPRIMRGDVLAVGDQLRVATQSANLVVSGVTRIRQALSLEVAAYDGRSSVRTAIQEYKLDTLRRVVTVGSSGSTSGRVSSITLNPSDVWDRQYLGVAIELDRAFNERSRGLSLQGAGTGTAVKGRLLQVISSWAELIPLGDNSVGEAVVAAEIATAASLDPAGVREMLMWRADGAPWGLIAFQLGLRTLPNGLPGVDEVAVSGVPAVQPASEPSGTTTTTTPTGSGPRITVPGAASVSPPSPVTTPPTTEPEPVVVSPLGSIVNGVGNLLGGLLGTK